MTALAQDVRTACEDNPSLFHAPDQERTAARNAREAEAKSICFNCPTAVRESCLQIAMDNERGLSAANRWGLYGGLNEQERADLDQYDPHKCGVCGRVFANVKARAAHASTHEPIPHGTEAGHSRHRKRKEKPCDDCREAHNAYNAEKRKKVAA